MSPASDEIRIRAGVPDDIPALVAIEQANFSTDQLAARNFRHLMRCGNCALVVAVAGQGKAERVAGYVLVLFRARVQAARIYSIAVDEGFRGVGLGARLVAAAESAARDRRSPLMRLEVRPDNEAAIRLYEKHGYRRFGTFPSFYEDGTDALRLEKRL